MCRTLYMATHKMAAEHKQLMYDEEARGYFVVPLRANGPDPFADAFLHQVKKHVPGVQQFNSNTPVSDNYVKWCLWQPATSGEYTQAMIHVCGRVTDPCDNMRQFFIVKDTTNQTLYICRVPNRCLPNPTELYAIGQAIRKVYEGS